MFAVEHEGVVPDLMTVAKGITGGYLPLAATLATERVFETFLGPYDAKRTFFHGHTYTGNPLACAAAIASMQLFRERGDLEALPGKVAALAARPGAGARPWPTSARCASAGSWWGSSWSAIARRRRSTPTGCAPATR